MDTLISITINSIFMMTGIFIVAGALVLTGNALVENAVEDEPEGH